MPHFTCPACHAGIDLQHPDTRLYGCLRCGALSSFASGFPTKAGKVAQSKIKQLIPMGTTGTLRGNEYTVIGYTERAGVGAGYSWAEYVLMRTTDRKVFFLSFSDGHWLLVENIPMEFPEITAASFGQTTRVEHEGKSFELFNRFSARYINITGEIPWDLDYQRNIRCLEFIRPPEMISFEMTHRNSKPDIDAFKGTYIYPKEIKKAFLNGHFPPARFGIAPAQPFLEGLRPREFGIAAILFCVLAIFSYLHFNGNRQNRQIMQEHFDINDSTINKALLSPSFKLDGRTSNIEVDIMTDLQNNWCAMDLTLVNETTGEERTIPLEAAYYRGVDGGESWSEGDSRQKAFVCSVKPGQYHFTVTTATEKSGPNVHADVTVFWDVPTAWNEVLLCLLFAGMAIALLAWQKYRETVRWAFSDINHQK
ncbi:DUF4178 domain-containing protein [Chitinophaga sp. CB10]|uniref:DUF4178 domain-containing protein n=1 Tax=Chitinophaga sp. CB10 TaxID=1891659 RepID=UPI0025BB0C32|nr:DUF4178 domain-containing protein [Chitinophaga sp. CB10]